MADQSDDKVVVLAARPRRSLFAILVLLLALAAFALARLSQEYDR